MQSPARRPSRTQLQRSTPLRPYPTPQGSAPLRPYPTPQRSALFRPRRETGGERRTKPQKAHGVAARPREGTDEGMTSRAHKWVRAGVRGGNHQAEFCHPGRSLVLSRERESTSNTRDNKQEKKQLSILPISPALVRGCRHAVAVCSLGVERAVSAESGIPRKTLREGLACGPGAGTLSLYPARASAALDPVRASGP